MRVPIAVGLLLLSATLAWAEPPGAGLHESAEDGVTQREIDQRFGQLERAILAAKEEMNERLKVMNEFRAALGDVVTNFSMRIAAVETQGQRIAINTELLQKLESQVAVINTAGSPFAIEQIRGIQRQLEEHTTTDTALATRLAAIEVAASTSVKLWQLVAAMIGVIAVILGWLHYPKRRA